ncbi:MAG: cobalt ECF transporter T component CbiQ [Magnetospirillum sp.]|nr:cobalt ECF transporter T component CbiQ [Magnetospirillum sp.]
MAPDNARCPLVARLDPRTRLLSLAAFALATVATHTASGLGAALAAAVLLALCASLPLRATLVRLLGLEGFMAVVLVTLPFTTPGAPLVEILGFSASAEGLRAAVTIAIKANAVVLATLALAGSLETVVLGHALGRLGCPERFVALFLFTVRYLGVLEAEYRRLRLAMRARAFRPATSFHTWRSFGHLIGMLMVTSIERSERIHAAMRCRGFTGRFHFDDDTRPGRLDLGFGVAQATALVLLTVVERA